MKQKLAFLAVLFLILACDSPDTSIRTDVEIAVKVEELSLKPIEEFVIATGTVNATVDVIVKSEIMGTYKLGINPGTSRSFALGDFIKKDQVIVSLENLEQENKIRIESQKYNLDNAKEDLKNQQLLFEKGGVSLSDLKKAERALMDAQYNYDSALMQLEDFEIKSPFDGVIVDLPYYTPGMEVPANSEMFHLMDFNTLNMEVNLPGKLLGKIKENQYVRVASYMIPDQKLDAVITQASPAVEPDTRTFKATININNQNLLLRPGMFVKAEIITASKKNAIVIPKDIILIRRTNKTVFVVVDGIAYQREISTGLENPDTIEITKGLNVNDLLVIEGFETLRNRVAVTISYE